MAAGHPLPILGRSAAAPVPARRRAMKNMRIVVTRYGGPHTMTVVEEECPEPRAGEVRVRVLAAGVSLPDVMMREGIHPEKPAPPFSPGWVLVGVVVCVGVLVAGVREGGMVVVLLFSG